jgi:HNH endonuclease
MSALFKSPPTALFARPPVALTRPTTPLAELPPGSAEGLGAGRQFPRKFNDQQPKNVPCTHCGRPTTEELGPDKLNGDHVIPRSQGGNNEPPNYAPACQTCNLKKGPRTPSQWYEQMRLQDLKA